MCGIFGMRKFGKTPIDAEQIKTFLCALEERGNHAAGIVLQTGDVQAILKDDVPAHTFVARKEFDEFLAEHLKPETEIVLGHTRAATKGTPRNNVNNHPLGVGKTAVVHNGTLHNDDRLFQELKLAREGEVDSDVIRAILDEHGLTKKGIEVLKKIEGSAAISAISTQYPGKVLLARSGSPLVFASTKDMLVWASTKSAIHLGMRPYVHRFGFWMRPNRPDVAFCNGWPDSAWLIGANTLREHPGNGYKYYSPIEWHEEFKTARYYTPPVYRMAEKWPAHRETFYKDQNAELPMAVVCPNTQCGKFIELTTEQARMSLTRLFCKSCGTRLG